MSGCGGVATDYRTDKHGEEADELSGGSAIDAVEDASGSHGKVTGICTHGWKERMSQCEGSRSCQHIRRNGCPLRFVVLEVKHERYVHNHSVSKEAFAMYLVV
ncbi:hypothetical protein P3T76_013091 [Phytophthora citrophthora]|uniref:Uncharacterized protein n=1 Tax=Phytophthora citrophthora TaxID=4793 RepID=A0AAD9G460_9STRA|nr:hypothetical protein P3T76_013091 [Phytophthora citrophthora]